jgi:hypothetical protein
MCLHGTPPHIVRRTRLLGRQATLWPEWRHFAFLPTWIVTRSTWIPSTVRTRSSRELAIKVLKEGAGMEHVPSGNFNGNAAWLLCAAFVHNLIRWSALLGELTPRTSSLWPALCVLATCPSQPVWSAVPENPPCAPRSNGRGPKPSNGRSPFCVPSCRFPCSCTTASGAPQTTERRR